MNKRPKICEMFNVGIGEKFRIRDSDGFYWIDSDGMFHSDINDISLSSMYIMKAIESPSIVDKRIPLSKEDVCLLKSIKLLFPEAQYLDRLSEYYLVVSNDEESVEVYINKDLFTPIEIGYGIRLEDYIYE